MNTIIIILKPKNELVIFLEPQVSFHHWLVRERTDLCMLASLIIMLMVILMIMVIIDGNDTTKMIFLDVQTE